MQKEIISLSKNTLIYGLGHILARAVTFLLLPLYTNVFSPDEYGIISLAYVLMGFMSVVMHYGLDAALMKRYVQSDLAEKTIYFSSAWISFFISSLSFNSSIGVKLNTSRCFLLFSYRPFFLEDRAPSITSATAFLIPLGVIECFLL